MTTKPTTPQVQLQLLGCTSRAVHNEKNWRWQPSLKVFTVTSRTSHTQCSGILNCSKKSRTDSSNEICGVPAIGSSIRNTNDISNTIPGKFYFLSCLLHALVLSAYKMVTSLTGVIQLIPKLPSDRQPIEVMIWVSRLLYGTTLQYQTASHLLITVTTLWLLSQCTYMLIFEN